MASKSSILGPTFQYDCQGKSESLADHESVKQRVAAKWDIKLVSIKTEVSTTYDKATGDKHSPVAHTILTFERNVLAEAGRRQDHYSEVYKCIHKQLTELTASGRKDIAVRVLSSDGAAPFWPTVGYVQAAYEVHTLGKFQKASAEIEELVADTAVQPVTE